MTNLSFSSFLIFVESYRLFNHFSKIKLYLFLKDSLSLFTYISFQRLRTYEIMNNYIDVIASLSTTTTSTICCISPSTTPIASWQLQVNYIFARSTPILSFRSQPESTLLHLFYFFLDSRNPLELPLDLSQLKNNLHTSFKLAPPLMQNHFPPYLTPHIHY